MIQFTRETKGRKQLRLSKNGSKAKQVSYVYFTKITTSANSPSSSYYGSRSRRLWRRNSHFVGRCIPLTDHFLWPLSLQDPTRHRQKLRRKFSNNAPAIQTNLQVHTAPEIRKEAMLLIEKSPAVCLSPSLSSVTHKFFFNEPKP